MATYQELMTRSQQVRDEQNIGGNTALRVGQLLMDIVKYFYDTDMAASEYLEQHFAMVNDGTHLLNWQQSPIVILHTMGETYDEGDFSALSQGENYYRAGFIMEANGQGGGINGETPKANVLYVNLANDTLYTWNGASFDEITSGGGGGISGDDIIKNAYYSNGNLVLIIETESGDKTVTIPVTFDASNYVPTSRTVNGKRLNNNITIQMADIPGLGTAIGEAGKVKSVSVNNGTPAQPDSNGNVNIEVQGGAQGPKGDKGDTVVVGGEQEFTIVNDTTTGGASDALSAEMGKRVAGREATDRQRIDAIVDILKKSVFTETVSFAALDALANATDSISLDKSSYGFVGISGTLTLTVTTDPAGKSVTWASSNPSVATVNNGVVTPIAEGNTIISATTADGKVATCNVSVNAFVVNSVTISGNDLNNGVLTSNGETYGATHQLSAVTNPAGGNISWNSNNESVATVNNGLVTIVGNGSATITASSGGKSASVTVNVSNLSVNSISLNKQSLAFSDASETDTLVATTNPAGAPVTWSSSDTLVATVNNGVVTSVGNGQCTITATCFDKTATCAVNVQALPAGFKKNKAWTNTSEATSSGTYPYYDNSLTDLDGFCVTPFYPMIISQNEGGITYNNYAIKIKGGFVSEGELEHVCFVVGPTAISEPSENEHVQFRILQTTNPMYKMSSGNLAKSISATFKLSELADCYIYDFVKGYRKGVAAGYLFAGSNVDTSKKPTKDNNDTYES